MSTPSRPPVQVTWDELQAPDVQARVEQLRAAGAPPLVRAVGTPGASTPSALRNGVVVLGLVGLVGGLVGWALAEVLTNVRANDAREVVHHWYGDGTTARTVAFVFFLSVGLGGVIASWEGIEARSWPKVRLRLLLALPLLAAGGLLGGYVTAKVYESRVKSAAAQAEAYYDATGDLAGAYDQLKSAAHVSRAIGFALFAIVIGLALGAASRSTRRAVNGAVGGLVGGALGGWTFDYVHVGDSAVMSRAVAVTITGTIIGLAVGLVEQVRKEAWLEIVSGGMAGKQFILYNASTVVGSGPSCDITLIKDPQVVDRHVQLERVGAATRVRALVPGIPFLLNGQPVLEATLADSDTVQVGSTVLRLREKSASAPVAGPILG